MRSPETVSMRLVSTLLFTFLIFTASTLIQGIQETKPSAARQTQTEILGLRTALERQIEAGEVHNFFVKAE